MLSHLALSWHLPPALFMLWRMPYLLIALRYNSLVYCVPLIQHQDILPKLMLYHKSWHPILKDLRYNQEDKESGQNGRKQTIWPWIQSTGGETEQYVNIHLEYAGCSQTIFTEKALDEIYRISTGIPRMINCVCEKTLMYAFQKQNRLIDDYMVKYVADHELING